MCVGQVYVGMTVCISPAGSLLDRSKPVYKGSSGAHITGALRPL